MISELLNNWVFFRIIFINYHSDQIVFLKVYRTFHIMAVNTGKNSVISNTRTFWQIVFHLINVVSYYLLGWNTCDMKFPFSARFFQGVEWWNLEWCAASASGSPLKILRFIDPKGQHEHRLSLFWRNTFLNLLSIFVGYWNYLPIWFISSIQFGLTPTGDLDLVIKYNGRQRRAVIP